MADVESDELKAISTDAINPPPRINADANAKTTMSSDAIAALIAGCEVRGPSAAVVDLLRRRIAAEGGFDLASYDIIFTAGGCDASSIIITAAVRAFAARTRRLPHVVVESGDHPATIECCRALAADKMCSVSVVRGEREMREAMRSSTCIVCAAAANGDTGARADVSAFAATARSAAVPFHSDISQVFGRFEFRFGDVDSAAISFALFGGAPGSGALIVRRSLVAGYGISFPEQPHDQLNYPAIGAALAALRGLPPAAARSAARIRRLRDLVADHVVRASQGRLVAVQPRESLPNTLLLAMPGGGADRVRELLDAEGIIVGAPIRASGSDRDKLIRISFQLDIEIGDAQRIAESIDRVITS